MIDRRKWWGIEGDSFKTHEFLESLGRRELLALGDLDRAVHIFRSDLLRKGFSLSDATQWLCRALKIREKVVPMTDDPVSTLISTPDREMDLQEFWVGRGGRPEVTGVRYRGIEEARPSPGFIAALKDAGEKGEPVLIGPSNPVSSIGPILALRGVRNLLGGGGGKCPVVAISPLVGGRPVSGPAAKFMRAQGYPVTDKAVAEIHGCVDLMVVSPGSDYQGPSVRLDTVMKGGADSTRLAEEILEVLEMVARGEMGEKEGEKEKEKKGRREEGGRV